MRHLPILSLILFPTLSHAADFDGASLSLFWGAPFALILLSIALGPLFFCAYLASPFRQDYRVLDAAVSSSVCRCVRFWRECAYGHSCAG